MKSSNDLRLSVGAVILCAGKGERTGLPYNKVLHALGQKTVLETVLDTFSDTRVMRIVVVASAADITEIRKLILPYRSVIAVEGGATRTESALCGLKACPCDIVVIHDGARPFASKELIERSISSAAECGSGIAAVRSVDTVRRVAPDGKMLSLPRDELYNIQTPQSFRYEHILEAYEKNSTAATDDAEVFARAGYMPKLIDGEYSNIKITTAGDLFKVLPRSCRIGIGYDVHRLVPDRPLVLGGVNIPHRKGLLGHSDADALTHAIADALLSAAGLPDIGVLFPDTDNKYKDISSLVLLDDVLGRVRALGYKVNFVSAVIIAQEPKLAPHIKDICACLAAAIGIDISLVNVSATTAERLGVIGNGEAIAAQASCIITGGAE